MTTVEKIIVRALRLIKVYEAGQQLDEDEAQDALEVLNAMLDGWSTEKLMLYHRVKLSIPFVLNQNEYTIGPGGDFDTEWRQDIENAFARDTQAESGRNDFDWPMEKITNDQYTGITLKQLSSSYPTYFYYRPTFPLGVITVWPNPGQGLEFHLNVLQRLANFSNIADEVSLPPGYKRAIEYNLAMELAPEYGASTVDIKTIAKETKGYLKSINSRNTPILQSEAARISGRRGGAYSYGIGFGGGVDEQPVINNYQEVGNATLTLIESGTQTSTYTETGSN